MASHYSVKRALPNFFTFGSMMCGFFSVMSAVQKDFQFAAWLIIIASVADTLDGVMARLTKTSSRFGVELDSLSDVISFGFAPAFLLLSINNTFDNFYLTAACLLYLFAGGFRLARFNSELVGFSKEYFKGLPIPAAAIMVASYVFLFTDNIIPTGSNALFTSILAAGLAFLMASKIKYDTIPSPNKEAIMKRPVFSLLAIISFIVAIATNGRGLFFIFLFFILYGILRSILFSFHPPVNIEKQESR